MLAAPLKQGDTVLEVIWFFLLQGSWPAAKEPWFILVSQGPVEEFPGFDTDFGSFLFWKRALERHSHWAHCGCGREFAL